MILHLVCLLSLLPVCTKHSYRQGVVACAWRMHALVGVNLEESGVNEKKPNNTKVLSPVLKVRINLTKVNARIPVESNIRLIATFSEMGPWMTMLGLL